MNRSPFVAPRKPAPPSTESDYRNPDRQRLFRPHTTLSLTGTTGVANDTPLTSTGGTTPRHRKKSLLGKDLARTSTGRTVLRARSRLGSTAAAGRTQHNGRNTNPLFRTIHDRLQGDRQVIAKILAPLRPGRTTLPAAWPPAPPTVRCWW
jgi:hypothetical protein